MFATLIQAFLTVGAAICSKFCHQSGFSAPYRLPSWTGGYGLSALAFLSASMGLQGSAGSPIGAHISKYALLLFLAFHSANKQRLMDKLLSTLAITALWVRIFSFSRYLLRHECLQNSLLI